MMDDRWEHHFLVRGEKFPQFWKDYFTVERNVVYILAEGFDPRMCEAITQIRNSGWNGEGACLAIELDYGDPGADMMSLVEANRKLLGGHLPAGTLHKNKVSFKTPSQRGEASRQAGIVVGKFLQERQPTDIIVDINAMPKSVSLSVLNSALRYSDSEQARRVNVHAVVSHNPRLDDKMERLEVQRDPFLLSGFLGGFETEDEEAEERIVWMPVLGPGQSEQLKAIRAKFSPVETCPAVPSPSVNPRKGDELIVEYQDLLIDIEGERFGPRNVLRVSEQDPFEAYSEIIATIGDYGASYRLLGGCKVLLSAHSSKLLSVACLLAAYDAQARLLCNGVSIAFVEANGHRLVAQENGPTAPSELFGLWLAGEPYIRDKG